MSWVRAVAVILALCSSALAQSGGGFVPNQVLTASELNAALAAKVDYPISSVTPFISVANATPPVLCNGTDQSSNLHTLMQSLQTAGTGATLLFSACTYTFNAPIIIPNDGSGAAPHQVALVLQGAGSQWSGEAGGYPFGATTLDIRTSDPNGHIQSYGLGSLVIKDFTITDGAASNGNPFIYITNTTLHLVHNSILGQAGFTGTTNNQDAVILGGTSTVISGLASAPFQGYGTVISENQFDRVRRVLYCRVFCNGVVIEKSWIERGSGNPLANGSAVEIDGTGAGGSPGNFAVGNVVSNNLVEASNYSYFVNLIQAEFTTIVGNNLFDTTTTTQAGVLIGVNSISTIIMQGLSDVKPYLSDATNGRTTTYISSLQGGLSQFPGLKAGFSESINNFGDSVFTGPTGGDAEAIIIQRSVAGDVGKRLSIKRSAADGADPGAEIFSINGLGAFNLNSGGAASINSVAINNGTTNGASLTNNLRTWGVGAQTGGAMLQNSGTGGSFLTLQNFGVKYNDQTGALFAQVGGSYNGIKFGPSLDAGVSRNAAGIMEVNNGTAGTFAALKATQYTSGGTVPTGNTGTCSTGVTVAGGATVGTWTSTAICALAGTIILTAMPTAPTGYVCDMSDRTTQGVVIEETATTATSATFIVRALPTGTVATVANDILQYKCMAY